MGCCSSKITSDDYIYEDVSVRISRGSKMSLDTQLKQQRIEIICFGCLWYKHPDLKQYIIARDEKIDKNIKSRPDLILNMNGKIIHVEIDEYKHGGYKDDKEISRETEIKDKMMSTYGNYKLIRFNPNAYDNSGLTSEHIAEIFSDCIYYSNFLLKVSN